MKSTRLLQLIAPSALLLLALLPSCSGGGGGDSDGVAGTTSALHVLSCTLGCTGPIDGTQSCSVSDVFENQTIAIEFNRPVNPATVNSTTVRVTRLSSGQVAPGVIAVDPSNPRRVTYRPAIAVNEFGQIVPGFEPNQAYRIFVRGSGSGAKITATNGSTNITTVECFVVASKGVLDLQPGPPTASVSIEVLDPVTTQLLDTFPADGAVDVPLSSRIRIDFDQVMDAQSLVDLATGTSPSVIVRFDEDGDPDTVGDQVPLPGTFGIDFDQTAGRTVLIFVPTGGLPSAGTSAELHRVVVTVLDTATDISGEELSAPVRAVFTPDAVEVPPQVLVETFRGEIPIAPRSSSAIAEPNAILPGGVARGRVLPGFAGGSGKLGDFIVRSGQTVVLGTGPDLVSRFGANLNAGPVDVNGQPTVDPTAVVAYHFRIPVLDNYVSEGNEPGVEVFEVTDGLFEFASLDIEAGGVLTFRGQNAPRLFVRGDVRVVGTLDVSGQNAPPHLSTSGFGGRAGARRAGGGAGGNGGDRPDQPDGSQLLPNQGPTYRGFKHFPGAVVVVDGGAGEGRGGAPAATMGGGGGGVRWPPVFPGPFVINMGSIVEPLYLNFFCQSNLVGSPGAGGSYGGTGTASAYVPAFMELFVTPGTPIAPAPSSLSSVLTVDQIDLDPDLGGALIGGAGGGGGGAGIQGTSTNGTPPACNPPGVIPTKQITGYLDGSGAAGGGGGGAVQLQTGANLEVTGRIDVSGGSGGGFDFCLPVSDGCWTAPGGGGSGGALLLQARTLSFAGAAPNLDVSGGAGGVNGNSTATGGDGGAGVVEIRTIEPITSGTVLSRLAPPLGGVGQPLPIDVLEVDTFAQPLTGPGVFTGFNSCWLVPTAGLFGFSFASDDFSSADPSEWFYSWNMRVELDTGEVVNWRGDSGSITTDFGVDLATLVGSSLGSSPLVVRFQGVRTNGPIQAPCTFDPLEPFSVADPDSLTPWFETTGELNTYWGTVVSQELAGQRRPNAFRAQFVFDPTAPFANRIVSVVEFQVQVQPL